MAKSQGLVCALRGPIGSTREVVDDHAWPSKVIAKNIRVVKGDMVPLFSLFSLLVDFSAP